MSMTTPTPDTTPEPLPCPFCGWQPKPLFTTDLIRCGNRECPIYGVRCLQILWNTRADTRLRDVIAEVDRATAKFPTWPTDPLHAFAVVGEEFGELQKELVQLTYEPHKSSKETVRKEAIQLAAMAVRFLMSLDRYEYAPREQHSQNAALSQNNQTGGTPESCDDRLEKRVLEIAMQEFGPIPAPDADFRDLERGKDTTQEGDEMSASNGPWVRAEVGLTNWPPSYRFRRRREPVNAPRTAAFANRPLPSTHDGWMKLLREWNEFAETMERDLRAEVAALRAKYESDPVEAEGQTPRVSYAEQAHELVDKLATAMRTREPFTPLILTFAEDIAAPLRADLARAEQALAEAKRMRPTHGDIKALEQQLADAQLERDAYKGGCESAKRDANEWYGKWELNQTEKINLRAQLAQVTRERDDAIIQRTRQAQLDRDKIIGLESRLAVAVEALRKCAFPNYCGGERSDMLSVVIERQEIARAAYETARQAGLEGKE